MITFNQLKIEHSQKRFNLINYQDRLKLGEFSN
jgi:hypothetical protein